MAINEKALGPTHPYTATSLLALRKCFMTNVTSPRRASLLERALAVFETALGTDHRDTADCLANLALLLHDQGELAERALALRARAGD